MRIFVINLARSTKRRTCIEQQLSLLNLEYEIVEAVDGSELSYTDIMRETRPLNYALSCGEVGCAISHINIYRRIPSKNIPMALILEDDALIDYKTLEAMSEIEERNTSVPTVTLLTEGPKDIDKPLHKSEQKKYFIYKALEAACSHGYIINNSAACKMANFLYPVWMVADKWQILVEYSVCNVEAVMPPVISKTSCADNSTIQGSGLIDKRIKEEKVIMWKAIKKTRSWRPKLKRMLLSSLIYPFLKISKHS